MFEYQEITSCDLWLDLMLKYHNGTIIVVPEYKNPVTHNDLLIKFFLLGISRGSNNCILIDLFVFLKLLNERLSMILSVVGEMDR
jgi:hypothetical protein